jgi:hypothetical protein
MSTSSSESQGIPENSGAGEQGKGVSTALATAPATSTMNTMTTMTAADIEGRTLDLCKYSPFADNDHSC